MSKSITLASLAALLLWLAPLPAKAEKAGYIPGVKIALEVRTSQGDLRSFQRPGFPPTYWTQDLPVVKGDIVTIKPLITTGGAELGKVIIRLDNKELSNSTEGPWNLKVNTANLAEGYHLTEVWVETAPPHPKENSANFTFLLVPQNDLLLQIMQPKAGEITLPTSDDERLACTIRSLDSKADKEIAATSTAKVDSALLFYISGGPGVKEYFYTLSRDGQVTYTSPRLPLLTQILLEPKTQEGQGQASGELILTVRAGDGDGRFGPPAWITVHVESGEKRQ